MSDPLQFTTDLPDVTSLTLDASEPESLTVSWDDVLNNGEYRVELRDDDPSGDHPDYMLEAEVEYADLEYAIDGILGGEQYSVRIRTQTEYVDGAWLAAEEQTKLIPSSGVEADIVGTTELTVTWTIENAFRGSHQIYRRRADYDYSDELGRLVGTVGSTEDGFTDDSVAPDRSYEYTIRTLTRWQHADNETADVVTTEDTDLEDRAVPPQGWYAELDHPSGNTFTPQILNDAHLEPRVNDLPQTRIPVPRDETWFSETLEGAPMRVYKDGDRRSVDELEDVGLEAGRATLTGVGGTQLDRKIDEDVIAEPAHELAERLVSENTDYVVNVDPPESTESEAIAQDPHSVAEWEAVTEFTDLSELPITITDSGRFALQRSNLLWGTTDSDLVAGNTSVPASDDDFAGGEAAEYDGEGDFTESEPVELGYRIPADRVEVATRLKGDSNSSHVVATLIDDETDDEVGSIQLNGSTSSGLGWFGTDESVFSVSPPGEWDGGAIEPGSYRLRIEATFGQDDGNVSTVDLVSIYDAGYDYNWPNVTDAEDGIAGPEPHGNASVVLDAYGAVLSVRGGTLEVDIDDTSGEQFIGISNDGADFIREHNTDTVSGEFDDLGGELFVELGLGRYGDAGAGAVPRYGIEGQSVNSYELTALLDDTPIILNRNLEGDLKDVLATIAEDSDSLYEIRQEGDQATFEWAQPGQRSRDDSPAVQPDYEVTKSGRRILKATVKGGRTAVEGEEVVADLEAAAVLEEENVISGTERVRSVEDGTRYRANLDYQLRTGAGELDIRSSGGIADGEELVIDYDYNVSGSFEHGDFDGDPRTEIVRDFPQASSERACAQAAKVLVDELSEPRYEADITIPAGEEIGGLIEALDLEEIPGDAMSVYEIDETPEGLQLRLGSRKRVSDTVQQIQTQLAATSERV